MHFGRRRNTAQALASPPSDSDPRLKAAMESMDGLIREAKANRAKVQQVLMDLDGYAKHVKQG